MKQKKADFFKQNALVFLLFFTGVLSGVSYSGVPDMSGFKWGEWIKVKHHNKKEEVKDIEIKLVNSGEWNPNNDINVYRKISSTPKQRSAEFTPAYRSLTVRTKKPLTFQFPNLPVITPEVDSMEADYSAEISVLLAYGYGLLFSINPQLSDSQQGLLDVDICSAFIKSSKLKIEKKSKEVILTISDADMESQEGAASKKYQTKIIVTLKQPEQESDGSKMRNEISGGGEDYINAVYNMEYQKNNELLTAHYIIEGVTNPETVPFLKKEVLDGMLSLIAAEKE